MLQRVCAGPRAAFVLEEKNRSVEKLGGINIRDSMPEIPQMIKITKMCNLTLRTKGGKSPQIIKLATNFGATDRVL